jgi:hypothetical protein
VTRPRFSRRAGSVGRRGRGIPAIG